MLSLTLTSWNEECGNANGAVVSMVGGGVPPYTYDWSNGSTDYQILGLVAGTYSLTVTDGNSDQVTQQVTIVNVPNLEVPPDAYYNGLVQVSNAGNYPCTGMCNGGYGWSEYAFNPYAVQPLTYDPVPYYAVPGSGASFTGYCAYDYPILTITDANGCSGTFPISQVPELFAPPFYLLGTEPSCVSTGTITVEVGAGWYGDIELRDDGGLTLQGPIGINQTPWTFTGLAPGDYTVVRSSFLTTDPCEELVNATVADMGPNCGIVSGAVFFDHDQDCVKDGNDEGIPYRVMTIMPGSEYAITNGYGAYDRGLLYGNYTVGQPIAGLQQLCPANDPVPFVVTSLDPNPVVDFADSSLIPLDVSASLSSTVARPGFVVTYYAHFSNSSGQVSAAMDANFIFDPLLSLVSVLPAPTSTVGNTISWSGLPNLGAFASGTLVVQLLVPPDPGLIGTVLNAAFDVSQPFAETTLANNNAAQGTTVVGSYDPNDKVARTSSGSSNTYYFIPLDEYVDYTIRFQNTGTDTAFTVVVTDTLEEDLDMSSFQQGLASHPFNVSFKPGRVVEWRFENILLPDSNTNEAASHGLVTFRIQPQQPLVAGTTISNAADIFFDFNPPVRTPPSVLVADLGTAVAGTNERRISLFPNPAHRSIAIVANGAIERVDISAADGRSIRTQRASGEQVDVTIEDLAAGSYVLSLRLVDGTILRQRFIKE